ncbi:hypothetical protein OPV22_019532 [Ensete ventricosum]|uniref:Uncharacterized protein n=1 Tax=Ensete ventricosum TaxID=4639 RepID=A0AAV8P9E8_ENSVE|nr:hypothetical protein OPV22_019532 [Ensete ventricosum]
MIEWVAARIGRRKGRHGCSESSIERIATLLRAISLIFFFPQTDLLEVVDSHAVLESLEPPENIFRFECSGFAFPVFRCRERPGLPWIFTDDEHAELPYSLSISLLYSN